MTKVTGIRVGAKKQNRTETAQAAENKETETAQAADNMTETVQAAENEVKPTQALRYAHGILRSTAKTMAKYPVRRSPARATKERNGQYTKLDASV